MVRIMQNGFLHCKDALDKLVTCEHSLLEGVKREQRLSRTPTVYGTWVHVLCRSFVGVNEAVPVRILHSHSQTASSREGVHEGVYTQLRVYISTT
jgi:hypothetical protein